MDALKRRAAVMLGVGIIAADGAALGGETAQDAGVGRSRQRPLRRSGHVEVQRQGAHASDDLVRPVPKGAKGVRASALSAATAARLCILRCLSAPAGPVQVRYVDVKDWVLRLFEELTDHSGNELIRRAMRRQPDLVPKPLTEQRVSD